MLNSFLSLDTKTSEPILIGGKSVSLKSQSLNIGLPFLNNGGLTWNRPVSVTVRMDGGPDQEIPITDVTRIAQIAIVASTILAGLVLWQAASRRR